MLAWLSKQITSGTGGNGRIFKYNSYPAICYNGIKCFTLKHGVKKKELKIEGVRRYTEHVSHSNGEGSQSF